MTSKLKRNAKIGAAAVAAIGAFEGLRLVAYPDPATRGHPWTVCYGETAGVKRGDRYTAEQCKAMFIESLDKYARGVESCVKRPMNDWRYVAYVSLAYNIGVGGFCKSSVVRYHNAGQPEAACNAMLRFNRAAGVVFPGLTKRRNVERAMCLREGVI